MGRPKYLQKLKHGPNFKMKHSLQLNLWKFIYPFVFTWFNILNENTYVCKDSWKTSHIACWSGEVIFKTFNKI